MRAMGYTTILDPNTGVTYFFTDDEWQAVLAELAVSGTTVVTDEQIINHVKATKRTLRMIKPSTPIEPVIDLLAGASALDRQEGGNHYKDLAIQPVEYITKNNIPYLEGNVIKYVTRHASKHGREDLLKARHYIDLILQLRYAE